MLVACHERVERSLALMERLAAHVQEHGADTQAQQAAQDVMRYFDIAAPAHHDDEERHVFPLIERQPASALTACVARLRADHESMRHRWPQVRADLASIASGVTPDAASRHAWPRWQAFIALHRDHLQVEETLLYPASLPLADAAMRQRMGREMAERRGVKLSAGPGDGHD